MSLRNNFPVAHRALRVTLCIAVSACAAGGASAESSFHGEDITVSWEYWNSNSPGAGGSLVATTDSAVVAASDAVDPDLPDFHSSTGTDFELWDVDFFEDEIRFEYTSIYSQDDDHQYMYLSAVGLHFEDTADVLGDIQDVQVDATFAPYGFDPELVSWDANNIWVDLQGSMCHFGSMGSMPSCTNPASPTGFDNEIVLIVALPEPSPASTLPFGGVLLWLLERRRSRPCARNGRA